MDINKTKLHYSSWVLTSGLCLIPGSGWGSWQLPLPRSCRLGKGQRGEFGCQLFLAPCLPTLQSGFPERFFSAMSGRKGFSGECCQGGALTCWLKIIRTGSELTQAEWAWGMMTLGPGDTLSSLRFLLPLPLSHTSNLWTLSTVHRHVAPSLLGAEILSCPPVQWLPPPVPSLPLPEACQCASPPSELPPPSPPCWGCCLSSEGLPMPLMACRVWMWP